MYHFAGGPFSTDNLVDGVHVCVCAAVRLTAELE